MPEPKAQLIDPQGPIDVPGLSVTGVTTATGGFVGAVQGTATGFAATTYNLNVGIVTATKFQGNTTGNVSGLADGTNINVGIITSTSFTGDLVGNAAGLSTTTANIKAGIMSATSFAGNFTGVASGITGTPNIVVGIMTGTLKGDGSGLTGIAATNWITNNVTANSGTTAIDLALGNVVKFTQSANTTVSFANTGTSNIVTFIRTKTGGESFSTGGVDFDGSGDYITQTVADPYLLRNWWSQAFTVEYWVYADAFSSSANGGSTVCGVTTPGGGESWSFGPKSTGEVQFYYWNGSVQIVTSGKTLSTLKWYHLAFVHDGSNNLKQFVNGVLENSSTVSGSPAGGSTEFNIGRIATVDFNGKVSNLRITHTAVYSGNFNPPLEDLTNITGTKLLCCQSDSSTTTAAVTPASFSAAGDPTAGAQTIQPNSSGETTLTWPSAIKWDGGEAPTLDQSNTSGTDVNLITLLTRDEGVTWYGWETISDSKTSYELWLWGENNHGQLGQNSINDTRSSPIQISGNWSENITINYDSAAIGRKSDGTLWSWGYNADGVLGLNDGNRRSSPTQIPGTTWNKVELGKQFAAATKTDGTMWTWGKNPFGVLGQNQAEAQIAWISSPTQIPGTTWSSIFGNASTLYSVKTDGTLWAWGGGGNGQMGLNLADGSSNAGNVSSPTQIPGTTWSGDENKWAVGGNYSAFNIKTDGTLWCWGQNAHGLLGQNSTAQRSSPVQIPGTTWKNIGGIADGSAIGATKTDGTLWTWGRNEYGQLGQNQPNPSSRSSPVQVPGTTWNTVRGGRWVMTAVKTDGTMWTVGRGIYGILGQNNQTNYSSPVQVPGTWDYSLGSKWAFFNGGLRGSA